MAMVVMVMVMAMAMVMAIQKRTRKLAGLKDCLERSNLYGSI